MTKRILIRFGDMMLKQQNIGFFIKKVREHIKRRLDRFNVSYVWRHDRIFIDYHEKFEQDIISVLSKIPGILDLSVAYFTDPNLESIILLGQQILNQEIHHDGVTFKIETKRQNKQFPMTSHEITQAVAKPMIDGTKWKIIVDLHNPQEVLHIELRHEGAYLYLARIRGMGGYPFGSQGKGSLLLSGGIDSPVAGLLAIKQGIDLELIHFESTPLTPLESVDKVIALAKILADYTPTQSIRLHLVPFYEIHDKILHDIAAPYMITIMRRMMFRIAEKISLSRKGLCLITGESLGQVASQTIHSLKVIEEVTTIPILRPLITYEKQQIITLSKNMGCFDISIRPFKDCCSIYIPNQPVTKPVSRLAMMYEEPLDQEMLIQRAVSQIKTLSISPSMNEQISTYGIHLDDAFQAYNAELMLHHDYIQTK